LTVNNQSMSAEHPLIIDAYKSARPRYEELANTVSVMLGQIISGSGIQYYSIAHRAKTIASLENKLNKPERNYRELEDITDLAGVRVITYFHEDVDAIAEIIEREFRINPHLSVDKRKSLGADQFGYVSVHYIANFSDARSQLTEYGRFKGMQFEIQIRSVLQHAWAEIEHDLGYKIPEGIPKEERRRFSRLAGILELADEEFSALRKNLATYRETLDKRIEVEPGKIDLNKDSLLVYIAKSERLKNFELEFTSKIGAGLSDAVDENSIEKMAGCFQWLGFDNLQQIEELIAAKGPNALAFAHELLIEILGENAFQQVPEGAIFHRGIGLLYLSYFVANEVMDSAYLIKFLRYFLAGEGTEEDQIEMSAELAAKIEAAAARARSMVLK
jgi:putative GTP pyrophosphokinase